MTIEFSNPDLRKVATAAARTVLSNPADIEDAVQDCFLQLLVTNCPWDGRSSLTTFIWRVAVNEGLRIIRRSSAKSRDVCRTDCIEGRDFVSPALSVEQVLLNQERREEIIRSIDHLPKGQQAAVFGYYFQHEGSTLDEVANYLGISLEAMKSRLHHGRKELANLL
jgi:RNA polymerase sigma-70 factor (ECF subfamily)